MEKMDFLRGRLIDIQSQVEAAGDDEAYTDAARAQFRRLYNILDDAISAACIEPAIKTEAPY